MVPPISTWAVPAMVTLPFIVPVPSSRAPVRTCTVVLTGSEPLTCKVPVVTSTTPGPVLLVPEIVVVPLPS